MSSVSGLTPGPSRIGVAQSSARKVIQADAVPELAGQRCCCAYTPSIRTTVSPATAAAAALASEQGFARVVQPVAAVPVGDTYQVAAAAGGPKASPASTHMPKTIFILVGTAAAMPARPSPDPRRRRTTDEKWHQHDDHAAMNPIGPFGE